MLSVMMLSVVMLSVVMPSVLAPKKLFVASPLCALLGSLSAIGQFTYDELTITIISSFTLPLETSWVQCYDTLYGRNLLVFVIS